MKESEITKQIRKLLQQHGIFHFKHFGGFAGSTGISDILGIYQKRPDGPGVFLAIEIKGPKGKLSDAQEHFLAEVRRHGGLGFIVHSTTDVIEALGLPDLFSERTQRCNNVDTN